MKVIRREKKQWCVCLSSKKLLLMLHKPNKQMIYHRWEPEMRIENGSKCLRFFENGLRGDDATAKSRITIWFKICGYLVCKRTVYLHVKIHILLLKLLPRRFTNRLTPFSSDSMEKHTKFPLSTFCLICLLAHGLTPLAFFSDFHLVKFSE